MLRALVPRTVAFVAGTSILVLGQAMAVDPTAHSSGAASSDVVADSPSWTPAGAAAYPGCVPSAAWPAGSPAAFLVVLSFREDDTLKMAFDAAWQANHDDTEADDVWVIGVCG